MRTRTRVFSLFEAAWQQVCTDFECELRETGWEPDHVLVGYPLKVTLSKLTVAHEKPPFNIISLGAHCQ